MSTRSPSPRAVSGLLALALVASAFTTSVAQQSPLRPGQTPGPRFIMPALHGVGDGPKLGFQVANAVRERIASDFDMRALWVVPESTITAYLEQAGYPADQPLSHAETRQLATSFRAEELLDGTVSKTDSGYRVKAAWSLGARDDMVQPLPVVEAAKISDVAKLVAREFQAARKQVDAVQRCINLARARNYAGALAEARKAIDAYPRSVIGRVCVANVFAQQKLGPDSMLRVTDEILSIHPENARALAFAADAFGEKKRVEDQMRMLDRLIRVEPSNTAAWLALIRLRADRGDVTGARGLADSLLVLEPINREVLDLSVRLAAAAKAWDAVLSLGDRLTDVDSSAATRDYFVTMIAAASALEDDRKALDLATRGVGKFPQDDELAVLRAQYLRRLGQLTQARAVIDGVVGRNPRALNAWTQKARIDAELKSPSDTLLASLGHALEAGDDRGTIAIAARSFGIAASRDSAAGPFVPMRTALRYLKLGASAQPNDTTSFLIGRMSVVLGQRLATAPPATKTCDVAREMQTITIDAQVELPKGGRAFPVETPPLIAAASQISAYADQLAKAVCH